jgi:S1-C subfamily serine protease
MPSQRASVDRAEGVAVKNTVSAPVALIAIAVAAAAAILYFGRIPPGGSDQPEVFILPFAPPVEDGELSALRQALAPMGVTAVFPPLTEDRFQGARIATVSRHSPAQLAGLQGGELIIAFGEHEINSPYTLAGAVARAGPEESYTIVYRRGGEEHEATITGITPPRPSGRRR